MAEAKKSSMSVKISVSKALFNATGTKILFPGFGKSMMNRWKVAMHHGELKPSASFEGRRFIGF